MPVAAVAAAGVVAGVAGGIMEQQAASTQSNRQIDAQKQAELLNMANYIGSRGGDPTALLRQAGLYTPETVQALQSGGVVLPGYAKEQEAQLFNDALAASRAMTAIPPEQQLQQSQAIINAQQPNLTASNQLLTDVFSGQLDQTRQQQAQPVMDARTALALGQRQGIMAALASTQNQFAAQERAKGYQGGGSFANNRMLSAAIPAQQQASQAVLGAGLQNAQELQNIQNQGTQLRLQSMNEPINRAQALIQLQQAPTQALAQNYLTAQQPLAFFKMTPGNPPNAQAANIQNVPSVGGLIGAGVAQGAGAYGNYLANQQLANTYAQNAAGSNVTPWGTYGAGGTAFNQTAQQMANFKAMQDYYE